MAGEITPQEEIANARALAQAKERLAELNERLNQAYEEESERLDDILAKQREELKIMRLKGEKETEAYKQKQQEIKATIELNKAQRESQAIADSLAESVAGLVGVKKDFNKTMAGSVVHTLGNVSAQEKLISSLKKTFSVQAVGLSIATKFAEATMQLAFATDEALVSFNKQTGATRLYGKQIRALERDMFQHGVGIEQSAEAYGALTQNVTDLRKMSSSTQKQIATTTALLAHMGVSADTTAANIQFMTKVMGTSAASAEKAQREMFALAQEIGMPPQEMAEGFTSAAPKLAAFGKQATKVYKNLAINAREAGMEVQQLLGIVEQFDTFEGAAQSVGKLNALLGGPFLNSMEMVMTTDPSERMRMLSSALNDAGKSFDEMSYYEQKAIASAAGLSDVNELALVMAGSFDGSAAGANKSQAEIQALAEQSAQFNTIMDELTQTAKMFAIELYAALEPVKSFFNYMQGFYPLFKKLTPIILGVSAAFMFYSGKLVIAKLATLGFNKAVMFGPIGKFIIIAGAIMAIAAAFEGYFGPAVWGVTGAVLALTGAWLAFNVATAGIPAIIGLIVTGIIMMIQYLFGTDIGHSNFLEGLWKIGWAFEGIGFAITGLVGAFTSLIPIMFKFLNPFGMIMNMWDAITGSSSETEKNMSKMSTATPPKVGSTIQPVEIVGVDPIRILGSILMPQSLYNFVGGNVKKNRDALMGSTSQGGAIGGGSTVKHEHEITLQFDPRKSNFEDFVINIVRDELNSNQGGR